MIKKISIITFLCMMGLMFTINAVQVENTSAEIVDNIIIVKGQINSGEGKKVSVKVFNPEGKPLYINDMNSKEDGKFEFSIPLFEPQTGDYSIEIGGFNVTDTYKTKVSYTLSTEKNFREFSILNNSGIINSNEINVTLYNNSNKNLVATFSVSPKATVKVGDTVQISGVTANDFSSPVVYTITAEDKSVKSYTVKVIEKTTSTGGGGGGTSVGGSAGKNDIPVPITNDDENTPVFDDLENTKWAVAYIEELAKRGILNGVGDNLFAPQNSITREEFVKIILGVFDFEIKSGDLKFSDAQKDMWYCDYIYTALENNIISGISEDEFGIGQPVTRQDMATIACRAAEKSGKILAPIKEEVYFKDEPQMEDYAKESIYKMAKAGIINGTGDNLFEPSKCATRAEAAKIAAMLLGID